MKPDLEVHILSHDGETFLPWALRHWTRMFPNPERIRICVHDGGPTGKSTAMILDRWPTVQVRRWETAGQLNDELAMRLKNACWLGSEARFVAVLDADELLHFAKGALWTLDRYEGMGAAVCRPHGFEMFSDEPMEAEDHGGRQITELVTDGAPDDEWYAKPILFSPRLVAESGFGIGAHESRPILKDGRGLVCDRAWPFADPPVDLLHFKSIFGGLERIAARYDETRKRLAAVNVRHGWGNFKSGAEHAQEKRDKLLPHVRRVVA